MFWVQKKVHWSDTDAAGIVWFPNFFGWFEDAEEELYVAALGRTRQSVLDSLGFAMPRVEAHAKYHAPVKPATVIRIGIRSTIENPRRMRHDFEMRFTSGDLIASGFVRVASVDLSTFAPRDFPDEIRAFADALPKAAAEQSTDDLPWV